MEIIWHGNNAFTLKGDETTMVIDPDDQSGKLKGDFVLTSQDPEHAKKVEGSVRTFDWPGEYEIKNVPLTVFQTSTKDTPEGEDPANDTILSYFNIDKIKICHFGNLGTKLEKEMIKKIEDVDVLMIAAGEGTNLDIKKAVAIIEEIDPRVVIPMGPGNHQKLLSELSAGDVEEQKKFKISSRASLPEDSREYVLLQKN